MHPAKDIKKTLPLLIVVLIRVVALCLEPSHHYK